MDAIYWVSLLVGGFFVILSLLGGGDAEADADFDAEADVDTDFDADAGEVDADHDVGTGPGLVDLFSVRALFLFAAFFGLTGVLLTQVGTGEPWTALLATLTGLVVGLGGNYAIKRIGYEHVSSNVSMGDLKGRTGRVLIPFAGAEKGKISLVVKGHRRQLVARALGEELAGPFHRGDEVVVVRMNGSVAEVVKPE